MKLLDQIKSKLVKPERKSRIDEGVVNNAMERVNDEKMKVRRVVIENHQYVFGMEWRLLPPTRTLKRTLKLAKEEGMFQYVLSDMEDLIGVSQDIGGKRGSKYSGALQLASKMSQGGVELFAFALQNGVFAVVALNDTKPIPGFDFVGNEVAAKELIEEFQAIQSGHHIRSIGNTGFMQGEETIEPEDIFGEPSTNAKIKLIPGESKMPYVIGIVVFLLLIFAAAMYWLNERRKEVMQEVQAVEVDAAKEYSVTLQASLKALPQPGPQLLKEWVASISKLPLMNEGWRLTKIECNTGGCVANWEREFGSYKDFNAHLPMYTINVKEIQSGEDPLKVSIQTTHRLNAEPKVVNTNKPAFEYQDLPTHQTGVREFASQLQEIAMLKDLKVTMGTSKIFGATGEVKSARNAIFSGDWSIEHEIWSLPEIHIAPNVITKNLVVTMTPAKDKTMSTYRLEGSYYVQAPAN